ncbi:hypothetical protein ACFL96_00990 [Thermoproteota archaeon]
MKDIVERLHDLDDKVMDGYELTDEELGFLFSCLEHENPGLNAKAAITLTNLDLPILEKILEKFDTYSQRARLILIPMLAGADYYQVFKFLFETLKKEPEGVQAGVIVTCLSKTEYFILPLIIFYLFEDNRKLRMQLKKILVNIGFETIKPYLAILPEIPHETVFREVYGDEAIESLKK